MDINELKRNKKAKIRAIMEENERRLQELKQKNTPKPVAKPVVKPVDKPVDKPVPKPVVKPVDKPVDKPVPAVAPKPVMDINELKRNKKEKDAALKKQNELRIQQLKQKKILKQQEAAALKKQQEAAALKKQQEAIELKKQQEAAALKKQQEADALKKQQEAAALKKQQEADALKKQQEILDLQNKIKNIDQQIQNNKTKNDIKACQKLNAGLINELKGKEQEYKLLKDQYHKKIAEHKVKFDNKNIKLMTYNVNSYSKPKRQMNILNKILEKNCDIIGLQEAFWFNPNSDSRFKNYRYVENDGGSKYYKTMLLFNKTKFRLLDKDKDNVKINLHNRGVNVVKLEHIISKKQIIVINVHLDHMWNVKFKGINKISVTINLLNNALNLINYQKGEHIIFMGDTNEFFTSFKKNSKFPLNLDYSVKLWLNDAGSTCCSHSGKPLSYSTDIFGSNNQSSLINLNAGDKWGKEYSDHTWVTAEYNLDNTKQEIIPDIKEVWAYDFDGVIHKLMKPGEDFKTTQRNPDHSKLNSQFINNYKFLVPYIFEHTIDDIKKGQSKGIDIKIVSANSESYTKTIFDLLKSQGINLKQENFTKNGQYQNLDKNDIFMHVSPKIDMLEKLKVTKFVDDSCYNIKAIYDAYKSGRIPTLKQLIFAIPETESYYNIDLSKDIKICRSSNWDKLLLQNKLEGVNLLYSKLPEDNIYKGTLMNVGNSCFLNTTLQLLFRIDVLRNEILNINNIDIDKLSNTKENNILKMIYYIFKELFKNTVNINLTMINGKNYYNDIMNILGLKCGSQEDAEQAYSGIIDKLFDSDLLKTKGLRKYFEINLETEKHCNNKDNTITKKNDLSYILSLPLETKNIPNVTINYLIEKFTSYEYVKPEDRNILDACKDAYGPHDFNKSKINLKLDDNISNLIIQLKRFSYNIKKNRFDKLNNNIKLDDFIIINNKIFKLKGIGVQTESLNSGHYQFVDINDNGKKYLYNDSIFREYNDGEINLNENGYLLNYVKVDLPDKDVLNIIFEKIERKYNHLKNVSYVLENIYNINNSVNIFKEKINLVLTKYKSLLSQDKKNLIEKINDDIANKIIQLSKYDILKQPFKFNSLIPDLSSQNIRDSLTHFGSINLKDINNFSYQVPNSASKSNVFRVYWEGKPCFMKTFTISGNKNLEYEQKIYNYINIRNNQLGGVFSDNFVKVYRVFKIKREYFKDFYNNETKQGEYVRFSDLNMPIIGKGSNPKIKQHNKRIKYENEKYIYFIVTEDIGGSTVADFFEEQCNNFKKQGLQNYKNRDNIMEMLFELIYGLYLLNTRLNVIHNDNHFENLLIKELPEDKTYLVNNLEYTRKRKYRVCIYDFDLSYLEGFNNPDDRLIINKTNQMNNIKPLTDVEKGRDIYTIGNSLYGFSMYIKNTLDNETQFNNLFRNNAEDLNTYNIMKIIFETDNVINNLRNNFFNDTLNNKLFWNSYCETGNYPCKLLKYTNITAEKVLIRILNSEKLERILQINNINPLFKKYLKYKIKYLQFINKN